MQSMTRAAFTQLALQVPEFQQAQQNNTAVTLIADVLLDTSVDQGTLNHYIEQLTQGDITLVWLIYLTISSDLYQERFMA